MITITLEWKELIKEVQHGDEKIDLCLAKRRESYSKASSTKQGLLCFQNRLYVPEMEEVRTQILEEAH